MIVFRNLSKNITKAKTKKSPKSNLYFIDHLQKNIAKFFYEMLG